MIKGSRFKDVKPLIIHFTKYDGMRLVDYNSLKTSKYSLIHFH